MITQSQQLYLHEAIENPHGNGNNWYLSIGPTRPEHVVVTDPNHQFRGLASIDAVLASCQIVPLTDYMVAIDLSADMVEKIANVTQAIGSVSTSVINSVVNPFQS